MRTHKDHKEKAPREVSCFVLTVSDTRTSDTDRSGSLIRELLEGAGHRVTGSDIVPDDAAQIRTGVRVAVKRLDTEVVLVTGGTGISRRDRTVDTIRKMIERELDGFGELFRMLSYRDIGASAMLSRAVAGAIGEKMIFVLPGSPDAVKLALNELILPELGHMVRELTKSG